MRVDLFDFDLPQDRIALRPVEPRDSARMLVVDGNQRADRTVSDLPTILSPGDLLVFNDTRVIPAQLNGMRHRLGAPGAQVGFTLHMKRAANEWASFAKGAKKLAIGDQIVFADDFSATVLSKADSGEVVLKFSCGGAELDAALAAHGHIPLPPYIASKRGDDARDRTDYQTVYARENGAVAAPTAGLHFTDRLLASLSSRGIKTAFVTLHVGAGTFLPVKVDDTDDHTMHAEIGHISTDTADLINKTRSKSGRIVSVGTTSLRLLETAAQSDGLIEPWSGATDIFITPGYRFKCVDALMTNFHLPKSTLMMLVSAFAGIEVMREAYQHAIDHQYRFYSYGDSSLLFRGGANEC